VYVVYAPYEGRSRTPPEYAVCAECRGKCQMAHEHYHLSWRTRDRVSLPCAGCGRAIVLYLTDRPQERFYCSRLCHTAVTNRLRRERATAARAEREPDKRPCEACGVVFVPARADARYCSSACRQRAYRARVSVTAQP